MSTSDKLSYYKCQKCGGLLMQSLSRKNASVCSECYEPSVIMLPAEIKRRQHAQIALNLVDAIKSRDGSYTIPGNPHKWTLVKRHSREVTTRGWLPAGHELALDGCVILQLQRAEDGR